MPDNSFAIYVKDPQGNMLAVLDRYSVLDLTLIQNSLGRLILTLPYGAYNPLIFQPEGILEVWRSMGGAPPYLVGNKIWLTRSIEKSVSGQGDKYLTLRAPDCNVVLQRHIIAHATGSAQTLITGDCDDVMKTVVKNEMGSGVTDFNGAATARDLSAYLTVAANLSLGPSTTHAIAQRDVLAALQDIAYISAVAPSAPTYLAFDVTSTVPTSGVSLLFQTFTGQRGNDHRFPAGNNPVVLSGESGSLSGVVATDDYERVLNYAYAGGQGAAANRNIQVSSDAVSIGLGPFGRIETFVQALASASSTPILAVAQAAVRNARSRRTFIANYTDTAGIIFGRHFDYGDYVTAWFDTAADARLDGLNIHSENGEERISLAFRTEL